MAGCLCEEPCEIKDKLGFMTGELPHNVHKGMFWGILVFKNARSKAKGSIRFRFTVLYNVECTIIFSPEDSLIVFEAWDNHVRPVELPTVSTGVNTGQLDVPPVRPCFFKICSCPSRYEGSNGQ